MDPNSASIEDLKLKQNPKNLVLVELPSTSADASRKIALKKSGKFSFLELILFFFTIAELVAKLTLILFNKKLCNLKADLLVH